MKGFSREREELSSYLQNSPGHRHCAAGQQPRRVLHLSGDTGGAAHCLRCQGNPLVSADGQTQQTASTFKDKEGRIKRQAARFQIYVYDEKHPEGKPLQIGDAIEGGGNHGKLIDIQWRVYLANKKVCMV